MKKIAMRNRMSVKELRELRENNNLKNDNKLRDSSSLKELKDLLDMGHSFSFVADKVNMSVKNVKNLLK